MKRVRRGKGDKRYAPISDRLHCGLIDIDDEIDDDIDDIDDDDDDVRDEHWTTIRGMPERKEQKLIRCDGKYAR